MPEQIHITVSDNAASIVHALETLPAWMKVAIAQSMDRQNLLTVSHIQRLYLSFPKDGPVVSIGCRVISNRLRNSIRASNAVVEGESVKSAIGSNVVYAAAQEFGFDGEVSVRPHSRKNFQESEVFGKRRIVRKADVFVRSFTRHMKLPGRHFVQTGIHDRLPNYRNAIWRAIIGSWNQNATQ